MMKNKVRNDLKLIYKLELCVRQIFHVKFFYGLGGMVWYWYFMVWFVRLRWYFYIVHLKGFALIMKD